MSFGTFARRVRDPALPYGQRVSALRSCVQLYRPIGFEVTLSFLETRIGPFRTSEVALLGALTALEDSRGAWQEELRTYAETRRLAKRQGQRSPRPGDVNPNRRTHWHGAERQAAALHAVRFWHQRRLTALVSDDDLPSRKLRDCVQACLDSGGALDPATRQSLAACTDHFEARLRSGLWGSSLTEYFRIRDLLEVARHLETATGSCPQRSSDASAENS